MNREMNKKISVDSTRQELYDHQDKTFPVDLFVDDYDTYAGSSLTCHWHHKLELVMCISGELVFYINGAPITLTAGNCIFINSGTLHQVTAKHKGAKTFVLWFSPSLLTRNMNTTIYQKYFKIVDNCNIQSVLITPDSVTENEFISIFYRIYSLYLDKENVFGYELSLLGLTCQIWKVLLEHIYNKNPNLLASGENYGRNKEKSADLAKRIITYINDHFAEPLNMQDIADAMNYSRSECFKCFKHYTGKTPVTYITEYRLQMAESMLMDTSNSISYISETCGFSTVSYFSKLFKDQYNLTPSEYRKLYG